MQLTKILHNSWNSASSQHRKGLFSFVTSANWNCRLWSGWGCLVSRTVIPRFLILAGTKGLLTPANTSLSTKLSLPCQRKTHSLLVRMKLLAFRPHHQAQPSHHGLIWRPFEMFRLLICHRWKDSDFHSLLIKAVRSVAEHMIRCSCPQAKCEKCDYRGRYPTRRYGPVHSRLLFELHRQNGLYPSRSVIWLRGSSAGASLCCIQPHACTCAAADTCMCKWPSSIRLRIQVCLFTFPPYGILNSSHCLREEIKTMLIKQYSACSFGPFVASCRHTSVFSHSLSLELSSFFSLSPLWVHFSPLICAKSAPSLLLLFKLFSGQVSTVPQDVLAALHPPTSRYFKGCIVREIHFTDVL